MNNEFLNHLFIFVEINELTKLVEASSGSAATNTQVLARSQFYPSLLFGSSQFPEFPGSSTANEVTPMNTKRPDVHAPGWYD